MASVKRASCLAALIACAVAGPAGAAEGNWLVRARAIEMDVDNGNDPLSPLGQVAAEDMVIPEVDISYFFTPHIAAELILSYPQEHDVTLAAGPIGSVTHLPPILTVQYHLLPEGLFRPYAGAGINYTWFTDVDLNAGGIELDTDSDSVGPALQVGFDYKLTDRLFLNVDVKKAWIDTDIKVKATGDKITTLELDPWLIGAGVGFRF